jgi:hypothetical protein
VRSSRYDAANHYVADSNPPEHPAPIDTDLEYSPSLAARFPSALRNKTLIGEAAVLAYHFWESRGCPRSSQDEQDAAVETAAAK